MTLMCVEVASKLHRSFIWLHEQVDDSLVWSEGPSGCYSASSKYLWLMKNRVGGNLLGEWR